METITTIWTNDNLLYEILVRRDGAQKTSAWSQNTVNFIQSRIDHFIGEMFEDFRHYQAIKERIRKRYLLTVPNLRLFTHPQPVPQRFDRTFTWVEAMDINFACKCGLLENSPTYADVQYYILALEPLRQKSQPCQASVETLECFILVIFPNSFLLHGNLLSVITKPWPVGRHTISSGLSEKNESIVFLTQGMIRNNS